MFYLLFIYLITIKIEKFNKLNSLLWKELINLPKLKEQENMVLDQKWKQKVARNFWLDEGQEAENP